MSMERHVKDYTLWILCVDDEAYKVLAKIQLPNVRLLYLSELETKELLCVKQWRTKGEYCWTLTPFSHRFVFEADPSVARVTYIDADFWFRKNPKSIFEELGASGKHVLITDHAYAPEYDQSAISGQYCVQFVTITRDGGEVVRLWWEQRCVEWCHARHEDGKFGDQKYLEKWPELFCKETHVLQNQSLILAPWNANRFPYSAAVAWHFHGVRIIYLNRKIVQFSIGDYLLPKVAVSYVYNPYFIDILYAIKILIGINYKVKIQDNKSLFRIFKLFISKILTYRSYVQNSTMSFELR